LTTSKPLTALQAIQIRYRSHHLVGGRQRALAAYQSAGVYAAAGVPVEIREPRMPAGCVEAEPHVQLGCLNGAIAEAAAEGFRAGRAVLMTGGNCSHAPGVLGGLQDAYGPGARVGLVWFDAHGDFNTPHTTLTGSLGGMPVAVCAGLGLPASRERAHIRAPLPTDRIVLVDVRNLDPAEQALIAATDAVIAAPAPGYPGEDLGPAVARLADKVDLLYLHVDADVLDGSLVPNHPTVEPDGPSLAQVQAAMACVMATGKVAAFAVVSVYFAQRAEASSAVDVSTAIDLASGAELVRGGLTSWRRYGSP
jgi:arginase